MKTIAIIDDDEYIGDMLEELLVRRIEFSGLFGGGAAVIVSTGPIFVLLDLMLQDCR